MIPEDQLIAVGGEVLVTPLDEGCQIVGVGHGGVAGVFHQAGHLSAPDLIDLVDAAADHAVAPALAAAGIDQQIDLVADVGVEHFLQVGGTHAAAGFQVGAAHIDHDGNGVLAVAADDRALVTGALGHRTVQFGGVGGQFPAGTNAAAAQIAQKDAGIQGNGAGLTGLTGLGILGCLGLRGEHFAAATAQKGAQSAAAAQQQG